MATAPHPSRLDPAVLDDPAHFTKVPGRIVFDEHTERDAGGEIVEKFDRNRLRKIADRCNRRDATGQLCPLAIGHTVEDEKDADGKVTYKAREEDQPELCGYARNFRVKFSKKLGRYVIKSDWYVANDKYEKASTFPRVSIERWKDGVIDPISLLRRTPARDLGQWVYAKSVAGSVAEAYGDGADTGEAVWRYARRGKNTVVRYALEEHAVYDRDDDDDEDDRDDEPAGGEPDGDGDPTAKVGAEHGDDGTPPGDGDAPPGDGDGDALKDLADRMAHHASCKECKACYEKHAEKYAAGAPAAAAGATDAIDPGKTMPDRNSKNGTPAKGGESLADKVIREARPAKGTPSRRESELEARLSKIEAERGEDRKRYARSEADKLVTQLADVDGVLLGTDEDRLELRDEFAGLVAAGDEAKVKKLYAKVRRTHQIDPAADRHVRVDDDDDRTTTRPSRDARKRQNDDDAEAAVQYMREHATDPELTRAPDLYVAALKAVRAARKK